MDDNNVKSKDTAFDQGRRRFGKLAVLGSGAMLAAAECTGSEQQVSTTNVMENTKTPPVRMHLGSQRFLTSDKSQMEYVQRQGVKNICGELPPYYPGIGHKREDLLRMKDNAESYGISLDMIHSFLTQNIDNPRDPDVFIGTEDERSRVIDQFCDMIRLLSEAEIPSLKYNLTILGFLRTEATPGRGGTKYSTWQWEKADKNAPLTRAGVFPAEIFWERITTFLERVVPVAEEYQVRLACHPHDPPTPPGYRGVDRVMGTVDGLKQFIDIQPSPYHGLNFCVGSVAEMLENPADEICDIVRYFGERKTLNNIHLRNIVGKFGDFYEVYWDEGDLDMFQVMRTLRDVGYEHMVMPDHTPTHPDDPRGLQGYSFGFGYIKALLQAVEAERA